MKKLKTWAVCFLCSVMSFSAVGCGETDADPIRINKSAIFLTEVGDTAEVTAKQGKNEVNATWTTGNASVATVNGGVITGVGVGVTEIAASVGKKNASVNVIVGEVGFEEAAEEIDVVVGETVSLANDLLHGGQEVDVTEAYTSKNLSVATVDTNGNVTANAVGQTTVTVSGVYYGKTFKKDVVVNAVSAPVLSVYEDKVVTAVGKSYTLTPKITVDGEEMQGATFTYQVADATVAGVAEGVISGLKKGTTEVTVKASYNGKEFQKTVPVVVNAGLDLDVSVNAALVTLTPSEKLIGDKINQFDLQLTMTKNGVAVNDKQITWSVENAEIATVEGSGYGAKVKAVSVGTTNVVASFTHGGETIKLTTTIICETPIFSVADFTIDASEQEGENIVVVAPAEVSVNDIDELVFGEKALEIISKDAASNSITVKNGGFTMGVKDLVAKDGFVVYNSHLVYATKVIRDKADFVEFAKNFKNNKGGEYYALAADIDMQGENVSKLQGYVGENAGLSWNGEMFWAGDTIVAWNAKFDGRGYAIKNAKYCNGLFCNGAASSSIENLAMIDCINLSTTGGVVISDTSGTVKNCYVKAQLTGETHGAFMYTQWPMGKLQNCVAVVTNRVSGEGTKAAISNVAQGKCENLFVVSADRTESGAPDGSTTLFNTIDELNASNAKTKLTDSVWSVRAGKLYFGNHLVG